MLASYTITINGASNGNVIQQPFTVEVTGMMYDSENEDLTITSCTKNGSGLCCINDDIPTTLDYSLPAMSTTKDADLTSTFENTLTEAYGANWSKN